MRFLIVAVVCVRSLCAVASKIKRSVGKNLLISFSGGETSAFMAQWLKKHAHEHGFTNLVFVFANTGQENEETLEFVKKCDDHFAFNTHWIEAVVHHGKRKGTSYKEVDFTTASRKGEPFESIISKYGIPNRTSPHCTREMKDVPITKFAKKYFEGREYWTAIGIRPDEIDRVSPNRKKRRFIYPLIEFIRADKMKINFYWKNQPFRLKLKGYQGNCKTCWKKANEKLYQISKDDIEKFDFTRKMDLKFGGFIPQSRIDKYIKEGREIPERVAFYRGDKSTNELLKDAEKWSGNVHDDATDYNFQLDTFNDESCEVFSECGS